MFSSAQERLVREALCEAGPLGLTYEQIAALPDAPDTSHDLLHLLHHMKRTGVFFRKAELYIHTQFAP